MINITVGGKPLYIPRETALVLEQNNNIFDTDGFTDDVVWTFEIPAEENQIVLGSVQYLYSSGRKRYDCELSLDGAPFSKGVLYVQTATDEKRLECGIVTNSFGVGFGEKMLRENDYGDDVVISDSEANHQSGWLSFLQNSLAEESVYKFFLFASEKFYGNNEDYGYHEDIISGLRNVEDEEQFCKLMNRLFFDAEGNIYNNADRDSNNRKIRQGVRIFNTATSNGKQNGYGFAPALRLVWLVRQVLRNAGLNASGSFFTDTQIKRLFSQSLCAMDSDIFQYGVNTWLNVGGNINLYTDSVSQGQKFTIDTDSDTHESFGWISGVNLGFRALLPVEELVHDDTSAVGVTFDCYEGTRRDEIYALAIGTVDCELPSIRIWANSFLEADGTPSFFYGRYPTIAELKARLELDDGDTITTFENFSNGNATVHYSGALFNHTGVCRFFTTTNCTLVQLTRSKSKQVFFSGALGGYTEGTIAPRIKPPVSATTPLCIRLVKCSVVTSNEDTPIRLTNASSRNTAHLTNYGELEYIHEYEIQETLQIDTTDTPLNIFSKVMKWRDHVPNLSNGEFLALMCQTFGLNMFANPLTKDVQLSFFTDTLQGSAFDITDYVTSMERMEYAPKEYDVQLEPLLGTNSVSENNIIDEVTDKDALPAAVTNKNKHCFVKNEKAYRRSTKEDDSSRFVWEQSGGDDSTLVAGAANAEEVEEVSIKAGVPNMRHLDETTQDKYICEVAESGCSPLFDEDFNGEFDFVLQQYKGKRAVQMSGGIVSQAYIEDANPTCMTSLGVEDSHLRLAADGRKSIGIKWLKPMYDFLGNSERYRLTAHMPTWAFLRTFSTLKPQSGSAREQVRWLQFRSQRFLPVKISAELSDRDNVVVTIECAARHYDVN